MRYLMMLSLVCFILADGIAQKETENSWTYHLGYNNTRILDQQTSPLIYSANAVTAGSDFTRMKNGNIWTFSLAFTIGNNQSRRLGKRVATLHDPYDLYGDRESYEVEGNPSLSFLHPQFTISYRPAISIADQQFQLGPTLNGNFFMGGIGLGTWFFSNVSLGPTISTTIDLKNGHQIPLKMGVPVVSWVVRENYAVDPSIPLDTYFKAYLENGSTITSFNNFQKIDVEIGYQFPWKERLNLGMNYRFYWYHYSQPKHLRSYSNQITLTLQKLSK